MDAIATRGHVILDDAQVRLKTSGTAQRFTELFALKADGVHNCDCCKESKPRNEHDHNVYHNATVHVGNANRKLVRCQKFPEPGPLDQIQTAP